MEKVVVVGAGIAGLTAAFRLKEAGFEVLVLERAERVGGRMSTLTRDGFRIDIGASILSSAYTRMMKLIADAGLASQVHPTSDLVGIYREGVVHSFHTGRKLELARTRLLSWRSKLGLAKALVDLIRMRKDLDWYDLGKAARWDVETARAYADRRLDEEALEYLIAPGLGSLCLASPERLSIVDFFFAMHNLLGGAFFNSDTGADFLCEGLAAQLKVELSARVTGIEEHPGGVRVSWSRAGEAERLEEATACVLAISAPHVRALYPQLDPVRAQVLERLEYSTSVAVHLGLSRPPAEQAMLVQVPRREHPELRAIVLDHNKAPGRAPPGKGLLASYWHHPWGERQFDRDDDAIADEAIAGIDQVLPGVAGTVELAHVQRWRPAVVMSRPGTYRELVPFVRATDPRARIQLAGDYLSASTTHSSLCSGEQAAWRIASAFGGAPAPTR
jgi:oxygen-dependent protoporphyrinogen oxidase